MPSWRNGRRAGLKHLWETVPVRVRRWVRINEKGLKLCFDPFSFSVRHQALLEWRNGNKKSRALIALLTFIIQYLLPQIRSHKSLKVSLTSMFLLLASNMPMVSMPFF